MLEGKPVRAAVQALMGREVRSETEWLVRSDAGHFIQRHGLVQTRLLVKRGRTCRRRGCAICRRRKYFQPTCRPYNSDLHSDRILAVFLQKGRFFSIADEVIDCGDHLKVRRARTEVEIPFSSISTAEVSTAYRMHRITIHLREQTKIGKRVDFWPQASLWGNLFAVQQVANGLADRGKRAIGGND